MLFWPFYMWLMTGRQQKMYLCTWWCSLRGSTNWRPLGKFKHILMLRSEQVIICPRGELPKANNKMTNRAGGPCAGLMCLVGLGLSLCWCFPLQHLAGVGGCQSTAPSMLASLHIYLPGLGLSSSQPTPLYLPSPSGKTFASGTDWFPGSSI